MSGGGDVMLHRMHYNDMLLHGYVLQAPKGIYTGMKGFRTHHWRRTPTERSLNDRHVAYQSALKQRDERMGLITTLCMGDLEEIVMAEAEAHVRNLLSP